MSISNPFSDMSIGQYEKWGETENKTYIPLRNLYLMNYLTYEKWTYFVHNTIAYYM